MSDLYKKYYGDISLDQSSYEVDFYENEYHLYRCLTEKEADEYRKGKDSWKLDGNRLYLYSREHIVDIEKAIKSYMKASETLKNMDIHQ
jgi:hypothetical protein